MKKIKLSYRLSLMLMVTLFAGCITPLREAITRGDIETTHALLDQGANVNERDDLASTPLHDAADMGRKDIAELLIAKGATLDVNTGQGKWYGTPLHAAALKGKSDVVKLLLAKGADPGAKSAYDGRTPSMLAESAGFADIARLLKEAEEEGPRRVESVDENPEDLARFEKAVQDYRNAVSKPTLPEEARKYKIQAEVAVREKKYSMAAELYGEGLNIVPWWPEGHFNRALVLGESRYYLTAMREMKRYLQLAPDAPDARAAQDKIYEWELKAK